MKLILKAKDITLPIMIKRLLTRTPVDTGVSKDEKQTKSQSSIKICRFVVTSNRFLSKTSLRLIVIPKFHFVQDTSNGEPPQRKITDPPPQINADNTKNISQNQIKDVENGSTKIKSSVNKGTFYSVRFSKFFVDKTKFIEEVINFDKNDVHFITGPRRWGKSVNLEMLRDFLCVSKTISSANIDILENPNRKLFEGTQIFENTNLVNNHFGQYPVMYFDFNRVEIKTEEKLKYFLLLNTKEVYDYYDYLRFHPIYAQDYLDLKKLHDNEQYEALFCGLRSLLQNIYGENPVVLIDEADQPITSALRGALKQQDYEDVKKTYLAFLKMLFKPSGERSFYVMTGVNRFNGADFYSGLNNLKDYKLLDGNFVSYYSFTKQEVENLIKRVHNGDNVDKLIEIMTKYYNGYRINNQNIYNCYSVINALNTIETLRLMNVTGSINLGDKRITNKIFKTYWASSGTFSSIKNSLASWKLATLFKNIFNNEYNYYDLDLLEPNDDEEFMMIRYFAIFKQDYKQYIHEVSYKINDTSLLSFLITNGYLTLIKNSEIITRNKVIVEGDQNGNRIDEDNNKMVELDQDEYTVTFPNLELKNYLEKQRDLLYLSVYDEYFINKAKAIQNMFDFCHEKDTKKSMVKVFEGVKEMIKHKLIAWKDMELEETLDDCIPNERAFHSLMVSLVPDEFAQFKIYDDKTTDANNRPDIYLYSKKNKIVIIIEVKKNGNIEIAYKESLDYTKDVLITHSKTKFKKIINIGLNINTLKDTILSCKYTIKERNEDKKIKGKFEEKLIEENHIEFDLMK